MPSEFDIDTLVREFLTESEEHFETLNADLLLLERALEDPSCLTPETIEEMFRATHTLKGLSSMFDFMHVKELAHAIESIFDDLRKNKRVLDAATVELLFDGIDALQRAISRATDEDQCTDETEEMTVRVRAFSEREAAEVSDPGCTARDDDTLGEYAKTRLAHAGEEGKRGVSLRLRWGLELRLGAFRRDWLEEALGDGEVLEIRPAAGSLPPLEELELEGADVEFEVIALTDVADEEIAASLGLAIERVADLGDTPQAAVPAARARQSTADCSSSRSRILRVDIGRLDDLMDLAGELVTSRTRLEDITGRLTERDGKDELAASLGSTVREMASMVNELQERVMEMRMVPVGQLFSKFPRAVRDIAKSTGKRIDLVIEGEDTELDKRVIELIEDPLLHMLRNACDHGIESPEAREAAGKPACGTVILSAAHEGGAIIIEVRDDGSGLDLAAIRAKAAEMDVIVEDDAADDLAALIMQAGFSTAAEVTDVSGRGVGLDVVARQVADLGGRVEVHTDPGQGTLFRLRLPLTLAIIPALIVDCCSKHFAVPLAAVVEVLRVDTEELTSVGGSPVLDLRGQSLPLAEVKDLLNLRRNGTPEGSRRLVVEVSGMGRRLGLLVDALAGQQEIVVKSIEEAMGHIPGVGGATILGDGSIVPILDVDMLVRLASKGRSGLKTPAVGR